MRREDVLRANMDVGHDVMGAVLLKTGGRRQPQSTPAEQFAVPYGERGFGINSRERSPMSMSYIKNT